MMRMVRITAEVSGRFRVFSEPFTTAETRTTYPACSLRVGVSPIQTVPSVVG